MAPQPETTNERILTLAMQLSRLRERNDPTVAAAFTEMLRGDDTLAGRLAAVIDPNDPTLSRALLDLRDRNDPTLGAAFTEMLRGDDTLAVRLASAVAGRNSKSMSEALAQYHSGGVSTEQRGPLPSTIDNAQRAEREQQRADGKGIAS